MLSATRLSGMDVFGNVRCVNAKDLGENKRNMKPPRISVVMPVWNGEKYVGEAIRSILRQTLQEFELIVVDDGSTDETGNIVQGFADERIRIISEGYNSGIPRARNKGASLAKAEYLANMDSDDFSLPDRLERQVRFLDANPSVGVVGTQMKIIDAESRPAGEYAVPCSHAAIAWTLAYGRAMANPTVMMRSALIARTGGYSTDFPYAEDTELWTRLIKITRFANLEDSLHLYRQHPISTYARKEHEALRFDAEARKRYVRSLIDHDDEAVPIDWLIRSQSLRHGLTRDQMEAVILTMLHVRQGLETRKVLCVEEGRRVDVRLAKAIAAMYYHSRPAPHTAVHSTRKARVYSLLRYMMNPLATLGRFRKRLSGVDSEKV